MSRRCSECGTEITGRLDRQTCSARCRVARSRRLQPVPLMLNEPDERHNAVLVGGPGHGMYLALPETTTTLVWDSPLRASEPGQYIRSGETQEGRSILVWEPAEMVESKHETAPR